MPNSLRKKDLLLLWGDHLENLTDFSPMFLYSLKTSGFLTSSEDIETEHWAKMG